MRIIRFIIALVICSYFPNFKHNDPFFLICANTVNISAFIRDSLSHDSIPLVTITVENLAKSYKTTRSSFYVALPPGTYTFLMEAESYESFRKSWTVTTEGEHMIFEMVKKIDRAVIAQKQDSIESYLLGYTRALDNNDLNLAYQYIYLLDNMGYESKLLDSMNSICASKKVLFIDSLIELAQALADSQKYADAYYYFNLVCDIDSLNQSAAAKRDEMHDIVIKKKKPDQGKTDPTTATKSAQEIEEMYNRAVAKFLAEEYKEAQNLLKTVLKYQPGHEGAKSYLSRTEARLKFTEN
jgi:hypothetical protein